MKLLSKVGTSLVALGACAACATPLHAVPGDSNVDFAAHIEHRGLVVDDMQGPTPAVLEPAGGRYLTGGPRFLLRAHDKTLAALWFPEPSRIIVRRGADPNSPLIGEVDAAWTQGAIHLTLKPADGPAFQTSEFARVDGRLSSATLRWDATTVLDVRGTYRAELRDANGAPAGWLRVQVSPHQGTRRIYDGVVPAAVNGPLVTAAAAIINSDVRYIRNHATNVYLGN